VAAMATSPTCVWLVDGARTVTGESILLDAGMHLGSRPVQIPRG